VTAELPPIGTRIALPVEYVSDARPAGYARVTISGYTVAGLGAVSERAAQSWHDHDADADTAAARVWAILTRDGRPAGQRRASTLWPLAELAAELDALELAVTADLAALDAGATL
jgi:hypothetical protein